MKIANDLALDNLKTNAGGPFGAVVVKNNQIVGKGSNQVLKDNDPTAHAEVTAIRDACRFLNTYDLNGCVLYTTCFPCPMCLSAIIWSNIKKVYYANTKEDAADIGFRDDFIYDYLEKLTNNIQDKSVLNLKSMNREDALEVFKRYEEDKDKIVY